MYRILIPVDADPDRADQQATFVTDLPIPEGELSAVVTHAFTAEEVEAPDDMRSVDRIETVRQVRDALEAAGIDVELVEGSIPPADGILQLAGEYDVDQILMGSRKRSPTGKAVFGSVSQKVMLESTVPVTVVGSRPA